MPALALNLTNVNKQNMVNQSSIVIKTRKKHFRSFLLIIFFCKWTVLSNRVEQETDVESYGWLM